MTPSEHKARAALLDAVWYANARCYAIKIGRPEGNWLDDATLQPVPYEVRYERRRIYHRMFCEMTGVPVQTMAPIIANH